MTTTLFVLHPDRVDPKTYTGTNGKPLVLSSALQLRINKKWSDWLDAQDPLAEHFWFADAVMGDYADIIIAGTEYSAEYIRRNFGESLENHFGETLTVIDADAPRRRKYYTPDAQDRRWHKWCEKQTELAQKRAERAEREKAAAAKNLARR